MKLKDVADYFGIHQNYLTRAFHEKFGISPKKYLLQLKFKKAARLLATTQLPVSIISNSLGFEDQLAFSRTFKKFYNVSPTDYRNTSYVFSSIFCYSPPEEVGVFSTEINNPQNTKLRTILILTKRTEISDIFQSELSVLFHHFDIYKTLYFSNISKYSCSTSLNALTV